MDLGRLARQQRGRLGADMARVSDQDARAVLLGAYALRGESPSLAELQTAQAVARFEGGYGGGWTGSGVGSNNWGAIQCGHRAPCGEGCFEYGDSDAAGVGYRGCFRRYDTPEEGAAALLHQLYRREGVPAAMRAGDATATATRMRATGYFEAPASRYALAIEQNAADIADALGEPLRVRRGGGLVPGARSSDGGSVGGFVLFAALLWGVSRWRRNAGRIAA